MIFSKKNSIIIAHKKKGRLVIMESNKKEQNKDHVKIYDKYMYVSQEKFKTAILIIVVFLIGFITGYFARETAEKSNETNENNIDSSYSAVSN